MFFKSDSFIGYQWLISFGLLLTLISCDKARVFEENHELDSKNWYVDSVQTYRFSVSDVSKSYNVLINLRNSDSYPYYNLFLRYYLSDSLGKELKSQQLELLLMDAKTGKPQGKGLGDIYTHQFDLLKNYTFQKPGSYQIKLKQYMRQDPLPEINSVGIRVEEVSAEVKK
jgi:gliding motility-associated lipoprotein GldH